MKDALEHVGINLVGTWWGKNTDRLLALASSELRKRSALTSAYSFSFSISVEHVTHMLGCNNVAQIGRNDELAMNLAAPGFNKLELAMFAMQAAEDTQSPDKRLANLSLAVLHLCAAKSLDVWASYWPEAYLNWHLLNEPESFPQIEHLRPLMLDYAIRHSFLVCEPALLAIDHTAAVFTDTSGIPSQHFEGNLEGCLDMLNDCSYTVVDS